MVSVVFCIVIVSTMNIFRIFVLIIILTIKPKTLLNIKKIYCLGIDPPKGADRMFTYQHADRKIYVPMEAVDKYKKAWYWSDYDSRIEGYIR